LGGARGGPVAKAACIPRTGIVTAGRFPRRHLHRRNFPVAIPPAARCLVPGL